MVFARWCYGRKIKIGLQNCYVSECRSGTFETWIYELSCVDVFILKSEYESTRYEVVMDMFVVNCSVDRRETKPGSEDRGIEICFCLSLFRSLRKPFFFLLKVRNSKVETFENISL